MSSIQFDEADSPPLKAWLMKRLEDISDADTDVLADYVIALIKSDEPDDEIRKNCIEQLEDFVHDHAKGFVDDVFKTLHTKSYKPGYKPPPKQKTIPGLNSGAASFQPQSSPSHGSPSQSEPAGSLTRDFLAAHSYQADGHGAQSKKRSFNDHVAGGQHAQPTGERPQKQMRGGAARGRGDKGGRGGRGGGLPNPQSQMPPMAHMPQMPHGFSQFDPNNPMATMQAMQAMGFPLPQFEQMPRTTPSQQQQQQQQQRQRSRGKSRCRDYDNKGFCAKGTACPYEHGSDHIVVPEAYDPANSALGMNPQPSISPFNHQISQTSAHRPPSQRGHHIRGRGGPSTRVRGGQRAPFSSAGPNHDKRITKIVVESVPEEKFSEDAIRSFFSEFGTIEEVTLQPYRRLAIIRFEDFNAARRAYESPKVIFDNRFVKVYWFKSGSDADVATRAPLNGQQQPIHNNGENLSAEDEEMIRSPEEFAQKQAEAQRAHEAKLRKFKEAETAKNELDERLRAQAEERKRLMEKLAAKTGKAASPALSPETTDAGVALITSVNGARASGGATQTPKKDSKATEALRATLAKLEAEAQALGIPAEDPAPYSPYSPHSSRGRGGYRGRGRGSYDPSRGGYGVPRGGHAGAAWWQRGGVARLDNRPKTVSVTVLDEEVDLGNDGTKEALESFVSAFGPPVSITPVLPTGTDEDSAGGKHKETHVTFHERYVAEMFISSTARTGGSIPGVGKVEMGWVAAPPAASAVNGVYGGNGTNGASDATKEGNPEMGGEAKEEEDYDVADEAEGDRWGMVT